MGAANSCWHSLGIYKRLHVDVDSLDMEEIRTPLATFHQVESIGGGRCLSLPSLSTAE